MRDRYSRYQRLLFDRPSDAVLRVTLSNPRKLNAMDERTHAEIAGVWADIHADPEIRAVIVRGAGHAVSAGGSFDVARGMMDGYAARMRMWNEARELVYGMLNCRQPIVSAISGPAVGAGLACALLADVSIAADTARLIDGHTRLGVAAGDHAAIIWPLLCGMAKTKRYLLLGEELSGAEAERIGVVSMAVSEAELERTSVAVAERLASGPATALAFTKHAINSWLRVASPIFDGSIALELLGFTGPEASEGLNSHLERRTPQFNAP